MTILEYEAAILDNIKDIYKADYVGKLIVTKEVNGVLIKLGMNLPDTPILIYTEVSDEDFIPFIRKELRDRNLSPRFFGNLSLVYPAVCTNHINRKCCDKR